MVQGVITLFLGAFMALASIVNPDAIILSARGFSWLPATGIFILLLGLLECLDAFFLKHQRDVIQNLQVGVLDTVIGALIIVSIVGPVDRVSIMIAAFLIVRGIVRLVFVYALNLPYKLITSLGGVVSIICGIIILQQWAAEEGWLISLCLNIEIAFRGWAGVSFALWARKNANA
jgi:uncharacterized membrane protein HdeD (DUF308 family)